MLSKDLVNLILDYTYVEYTIFVFAEKNLNKVDWKCLSNNFNANRILEKNLDKVDWKMLLSNPNANFLLEQKLDRVDWAILSENPGIFTPKFRSKY